MMKGFSGKSKKAICFLLLIWFTCQISFSQESAGQTSSHAVPNLLRRPERGEAPRYPTDLVIGELGRGDASEGAYSFARSILSALTDGRRNAPVFADSASYIAESLFEEIQSLRPRTFRLGGGRNEPDGCVSFLIRFISREESITGELFVRWMDASESGSGTGRWILDDLVLEGRRSLVEIREIYRFNFSPYERFF
jgi:hypothetical protein